MAVLDAAAQQTAAADRRPYDRERAAAEPHAVETDTMSNRFGRETWSITVPDGWHARHDPECATLEADPPVGALQISMAFKESPVLDEDLREFASDHLEAGAVTRPVVAGEFVGFEIAYGAGDTFWRQWFLRRRDQALFVTYNCHESERGREDSSVAKALASLSGSGARGD